MEKNRKQLILSLIKDDLINTKLVNGLSNLGLIADDYMLHLSDTIFKLSGIEDALSNEFIYKKYSDMIRRVSTIDITKGHDKLNPLAEEIYMYLLKVSKL